MVAGGIPTASPAATMAPVLVPTSQIKPPAKVQTGVSEIAVRRETPTEFVKIGCSIDAAHPTPVYAQDAVGSWLFCAARWCHCSALNHWGYYWSPRSPLLLDFMNHANYELHTNITGVSMQNNVR